MGLLLESRTDALAASATIPVSRKGRLWAGSPNSVKAKQGGHVSFCFFEHWGSPCHARVWDLASGREPYTLESNDTHPGGLALRPDARSLVGSSFSAIRV